MRLPLFLIILLLVAGVVIDCYIFFAIKRYSRNKVWLYTHIALSSLLYLMMLCVMFMPVRTGSDTMLRSVMWMVYTFLTVYASKLVFIIVDLISRLPLFWKKKPWKGVSVGGAALATVIFLTMWWGALFNRFNIDVRRVDVKIENLPKAFDGFTIAQISDLHVGTYGSDTVFLHNLVERINELKPDLIVFTGDIVNRKSDELKPFVSTLAGLKAPYGVYSILGNHDYGDYVDWDNPSQKTQNLAQLKDLQRKMGWRLLNNEYAPIVSGTDTLMLVGVENVGDPPFHTYGDLAKAYPTPADSLTKILLTHNPAHWHNDISGHKGMEFDLTLAGHTHAMQCELFSLSPAAMRYDEWGGIYDDGDGRRLYVNIGTGTVGIPARIGATPEITLITLRR